MPVGRAYGMKSWMILTVSRLSMERWRKAFCITRQAGGFVSVIDENVKEYIEEQWKVLTNEDLEELVKHWQTKRKMKKKKLKKNHQENFGAVSECTDLKGKIDYDSMTERHPYNHRRRGHVGRRLSTVNQIYFSNSRNRKILGIRKRSI